MSPIGNSPSASGWGVEGDEARGCTYNQAIMNDNTQDQDKAIRKVNTISPREQAISPTNACHSVHNKNLNETLATKPISTKLKRN